MAKLSYTERDIVYSFMGLGALGIWYKGLIPLYVYFLAICVPTLLRFGNKEKICKFIKPLSTATVGEDPEEFVRDLHWNIFQYVNISYYELLVNILATMSIYFVSPFRVIAHVFTGILWFMWFIMSIQLPPTSPKKE